MQNLCRIQTLLAVIFSLLVLPWAAAQVADPIVVHVKSTGSSYIDQFPANTDYAFSVIKHTSHAIGDDEFLVGSSPNTVKVTFTPRPGAVGSTDLIVTYYTLSAPMHPVTRSYRFWVADEVIMAGQDRYVVDSAGTDIPFAVLANDSTSGSALHIASLSVANSGSAYTNVTGDTIFYTPDAEFSGDTWIQYVACDTAGNCGEGKVHILVRDPNSQDVLTYKKFLLNSEQLEILTPFVNYNASLDPSNGSLTSPDSISWVYTPDEGFAGNDTFELSLQGLLARKYIVTVYDKTLNVQAVDDKFYVRPGLSVSFNVLNNDLLDFDISGHTNPAKGSLNDLGDGLFTYTPVVGYRGVDKFTYTVCYGDTVYCETATVLLHVTDLEPENVLTYALQTSQDLPLTIDYAIAYTDFTYIISQQPAHGTFVFNEGVQEIDLPCDTLESYNMLVYTPEAGYTGPDHFEYYYCIEPSNICYLVKVDMNVVSPPEAESCACILNCAWPGDCDQDGRVDMADLLTLGYGLGATGLPRGYSDPSAWFGQHLPAWPGDNANRGSQYLDGNGDGVVTSDDVDAISDHYYQTHNILPRDVQQKLPYQFSLIPVQFSLDSGDLVILDVSLGTANVPVLDLKGVKFSINLPPNMADSSTVDVNWHQDSWLAQGSPAVSLHKVPWDGRIDAGYAKANGDGASGFGVVSTVVFIIVDDIEGFKTDNGLIHIPVSLLSGAGLGADGNIYDIDGAETYLEYDPHKVKKDPYQLILYPNPAQDIVNIHLNGKTAINSIAIYDTQGRKLSQTDHLDTKHYEFDASYLPAGLYYVQVRHENGVMTQPLSVIR